jgi:hypothetical protein
VTSPQELSKKNTISMELIRIEGEEESENQNIPLGK